MASYTLIGNFDAQITELVVAPVYVKNGEYPCRLLVDSEIVYVTGGAGTAVLSVNRGGDNTAKAAHTSGTTIADAPVPTS